ncbi:MAG: hypothetical protein QM674_16180 [Burkholderiaceae bacterium]
MAVDHRPLVRAAGLARGPFEGVERLGIAVLPRPDRVVDGAGRAYRPVDVGPASGRQAEQRHGDGTGAPGNDAAVRAHLGVDRFVKPFELLSPCLGVVAFTTLTRVGQPDAKGGHRLQLGDRRGRCGVAAFRDRPCAGRIGAHLRRAIAASRDLVTQRARFGFDAEIAGEDGATDLVLPERRPVPSLRQRR